jgi:glycosyltransferase involved in cell wall biosynthesis
MHVAMVTEFPERLDHPRGGVQAAVACLTRALVRQGVELTILRYGGDFRSSTVHAELGWRVLGIPRLRPGNVTCSTIAPIEVERALRRVAPDVVHVQAIPELYAGKRLPSVLTLHGIPYREVSYERRLLQGAVRRLRRFTYLRAIQRYQQMILISPYVLRELEREEDAACHRIPNPVEDRFFEVTRAPETHRVLFSGRLDRLKNAAALIEAAAILKKRHPELRYRMAGSWDEAYRPQLLAAVERHGLASRFEFLGSLSRERMIEELSRCTCLVLPSHQENAPMAVLEAMAAGVPAAASSVGGLPWMIEDGSSGLLFAPDRPDQLADAIGRLVSQQGLREAISDNARRWAKENLRMDAVARRTIEVYERALRGGERAHL